MEKQAIVIKLVRTTKRAAVYEEQTTAGKPEIITQLYLPQWLVGTQPLQSLKLTLEENK